jgi:transketolase
MEGISQEAISLAGHLKLDNLVLVYDNNKISIDGSTDLSFSDNTNLRFKSVNWNVLNGDGHNHKNIKRFI